MPGFSGQGYVSIAERLPSGQPGVFRQFGNADVFELGLSEESVERNESQTGQRLPNRKLTKSRGGTLKLKGDEFNAKNFALAVLGKVIDVSAGQPVAGYALQAGLLVGDIVALPAKNVTAVTVKDSTASAAKALTKDVHYKLDDLAGDIELLDITTGGPYTQPFKVDYTPGAYRAIGAFQNTSKEYYIRLKGTNTDTGDRGICEVYRVKISPTKAIALINNDYLDWDLECSLLSDLTRNTTDAGGTFFGFFQPPAA